MRILVPLLICCAPAFTQQSQDATETADSMERFQFTDKQDVEHTILARVIVEAQDGGVLVEDRAERYWNITAAQMKERTPLAAKYSRLSEEERTTALKNEFGVGFAVTTTDHYLIASNASAAYSEWCGAMLEKFLVGYTAFWEKEEDIQISKLEHTLIVIVLSNKAQFDAFYQRDVGQKSPGSFGYYSIEKNRVVLYDFASPESLTNEERQKQTARDVRRAVRDVPFSVATVIHEAFHQLAFNTGLHKRYADNPLWLVEGLAMYFETPSKGTGSKWTGIGKTNEWRKTAFKTIQASMNAELVTALMMTDERFRTAETATGAYPAAWALTTYLMKRKREQFVAFIGANMRNPQAVWDTGDELVQKRNGVVVETLGAPTDFERPMQSYFKRIR